LCGKNGAEVSDQNNGGETELIDDGL